MIIIVHGPLPPPTMSGEERTNGQMSCTAGEVRVEVNNKRRINIRAKRYANDNKNGYKADSHDGQTHLFYCCKMFCIIVELIATTAFINSTNNDGWKVE